MKEYFIVQYFYLSDECRMNHSFEIYQTNYYEVSEVKAYAEETVENNKDDIHGYYITKQEILESYM